MRRGIRGSLMEEFWFFSPLTLKEVGERLGGEFRFSDAKFDCENVYEWFEVKAPDGLRLNVSRKHPNEEPDLAEPFRVRASDYRSVDDLGGRLADCLRTTIYYGKVAYLGGDDFRYIETTRFEASA
jgi:hypothetical protein